MDEVGDPAPQIQRRMQFDCRLGGAKWGPREQRQAQFDGGGIQGINRVAEFDAETVVAVRLSGTLIVQGRQVGPDAPIPSLVSLGQCGTFDLGAAPPAVQYEWMYQEAGLYVA